MRYKLNKIEHKKYNDSEYVLVANPIDIQGNPVPKFTIWRKGKDGMEFPGYDGIVEGGEIEGNLWNKPGTDNYTLYPPKSPKTAPGRTDVIKQAMERKEKAIETFQDKKEESIAKSGAQRDAVLMVTTFYPEIADMITGKDETLKKRVEEWYEYFMNRGSQPF